MQQSNLEFDKKAEAKASSEPVSSVSEQQAQSEIRAELDLSLLLKQARKAKKISISDVASQLHLKPAIIEKIEAGDLADIDRTYMRGYIRSYARLLKVSDEKVDNAFSQMGLLEEAHEMKQTTQFKVHQKTAKDKSIRLITYAIIIILILLVVIGRYMHHKNTAAPALTTSTATNSVTTVTTANAVNPENTNNTAQTTSEK